MVYVVEVATLFSSTKSDPLLPTESASNGVVVPIPRRYATLEATVVEVATRLVKVNCTASFSANPAPSIAEVQGVCDPPAAAAHTGTPPVTVRTWLELPMASFERTLVAEL